MDLATSKKLLFCLAVVSYAVMFEQQQHPGLLNLPLEQQLQVLGLSGRSSSSWALIAYSALGPGALATWLEAEGQSTIPATQAQVRVKGFILYSGGPRGGEFTSSGFQVCFQMDRYYSNCLPFTGGWGSLLGLTCTRLASDFCAVNICF